MSYTKWNVFIEGQWGKKVNSKRKELFYAIFPLGRKASAFIVQIILFF